MSTVSIDFAANLKQAQEAFAQTTGSIRSLSDAVRQMEMVSRAAEKRMQSLLEAKEKTKKQTSLLSDAMNGLITRFGGLVSAGAAVYAALNYIGTATQAMVDRARAGSEALRALDQSFKQIAGAAGYGLNDTRRTQAEALRIGVEAKVGPELALPVTAKAMRAELGGGAARTALEMYRTTGTDPMAFIEALDRAKGAGREIAPQRFAALLMSLAKRSGEGEQDILGLLGSLTGIEGGNYDVESVGGLTSVLVDRLDTRRARSAATTILTALAGTADGNVPLTPDEISAAARGERVARGKRQVRLTGSIEDRLAQLKSIDPERYQQLKDDPISGVAVSAIESGATRPVQLDEQALPRALRARNAGPQAAYDAREGMRSAVAAQEVARGEVYDRVEAKRLALVAALEQAGAGALAIQWSSTTLPNLITRFGGDLKMVEAELDRQARNAIAISTPTHFSGFGRVNYLEERFDLSLDARRVLQGTAGLIPLRGADGDAFITPQRYRALRETYRGNEDAMQRAIDEMLKATRENANGVRVLSRAGGRSMRDWRGDDFAARVAYPPRSAAGYFG